MTGGFIISKTSKERVRGEMTKKINVRYIKVIVNDWFLTQSGDFCGNTIVPIMSMTCNKQFTEKLLPLDLHHNDFTTRICWLLICSAFVCCCLLNIQRVDIVIRYIEVDFTFRLLEYVCYIEEFVILRFVLYRGSIPYILL